jgi:hypothetical protein
LGEILTLVQTYGILPVSALNSPENFMMIFIQQSKNTKLSEKNTKFQLGAFITMGFEFIRKHNAVEPVEIKPAFSLSDDQMNGFLNPLFFSVTKNHHLVTLLRSLVIPFPERFPARYFCSHNNFKI